MRPHPILLEPILKPRVWGGRRLESLGKRLPEGVAIGESWEVADLPESVEDGRSTVANGPRAGETLRGLLDAHERLLLGAARRTAEGGFPLLIKYLDARENLSIQVHPPATYAALHPGTHVKDEAWVVIAAEPGAVVYRGLLPGVTPERLAEDIRTDRVVRDLVAVPARPGDCHVLPSGTCHALGAGILVAEVQTPSDTTFRVYDWGRTDRPLHVEQALACIDFEEGGGEVPRSAQPIEVERLRTTPLVDRDCFAIERVEALGPTELAVVTNDLPVIWMVTGGRGRVSGGGMDVPLAPGTTVVLPAALEDGIGVLSEGCTLLRVTPPSPIHGALA
jgi:mannose-6-phosphate isomerase